MSQCCTNEFKAKQGEKQPYFAQLFQDQPFFYAVVGARVLEQQSTTWTTWGFLVKVGYSWSNGKRCANVQSKIAKWRTSRGFDSLGDKDGVMALHPIPHGLHVTKHPLGLEKDVRQNFGTPLLSSFCKELRLPIHTEWVICDANRWTTISKQFQELRASDQVDSQNLFLIPHPKGTQGTNQLQKTIIKLPSSGLYIEGQILLSQDHLKKADDDVEDDEERGED